MRLLLILLLASTTYARTMQEAYDYVIPRWLEPTDYAYSYLDEETNTVKEFTVCNNLQTIVYYAKTNLTISEIYYLQLAKEVCRREWDNNWEAYCNEYRVPDKFRSL